jgi:hypothetical protein
VTEKGYRSGSRHPSARATIVGGVTMRFERRPGSEETLLALYDAVVAAEELDLVEQADHERRWAFVQDDDSSVEGADQTDPDDVPDGDDRPTMSQALGIVEHLLGGHPVTRD